MSIRLKLTIIFLAFVLVPSLFVSVLTFTSYKDSMEAEHLLHLQHIASFKTDKIETYFAELKTNLDVSQGYYNIRKNLPALVRLAGSPNDPELLLARQTLDMQLRHMQSVLSLSDIMLVSPRGEIVYSSNPAHGSIDFLQGLPDPRQKAFEEGKRGVYFSDIFLDKALDNKPAMLITGPAFDLDGSFAGVTAFELDMDLIYKLLQNVTGLGETGEILLGRKIDNEVIFLNPLRHDPEAALKKKITIGGELGGPVQEAAQGRKGAGRLIDYRGKEVIAAWQHVPSLGWGMVAKIDTEEAFAEVTNLRRLVFIVVTIVFVLSSLISASIAQTISKPIKKLSEGAEIIGRGNLDHKVGTDLKNEIGQLSRSFDKMTGDLKKITASRDELNKEIAERKQAEAAIIRAKEEWERTFNSVPDLIAILDTHHRIVRVNQAMAQRLGLDAEQCIGLPCYKYVHGLSAPPDFCPHSQTLKDYRQHIGEVSEPRLGGDFLVSTTPLFDEKGEMTGSVHVARDITERKQAEEKIRTLNEDLRNKVIQLEAANKELDAFSYSVSHDLRSPLRSIAGFSQAIVEDYSGKLDANGKDYLDRISAATRRMGQLIDDLLNLSRVTRAGMKPERVNLSRNAMQIADRLRKTQPERKVEFIIAGDIFADADEQLLNVALENLIGNAWKFTSKHPTARIEFGVINEEISQIGLTGPVYFVKDNGAGFDKTYTDKLFNPFQRLHGLDKFPGTGIGLATVKRIISRHGGQVWIEGETGKGATVYFTL